MIQAVHEAKVTRSTNPSNPSHPPKDQTCRSAKPRSFEVRRKSPYDQFLGIQTNQGTADESQDVNNKLLFSVL